MTRFPASRRGLLQTASVAAPPGLIGRNVFARGRVTIPGDLLATPICKFAFPVPVTVLGERRAIR